MTLRDTLRRWFGAAEQPRQWRGRYSSMEEARRASGLQAYQALARQSAYIAQRLTPSGNEVLDRKHALILAGLNHCLAARGGAPLRVIDFGGGLGLHHARLAPALPPGSVAAWSIVELPEVAEAGRRSAPPAPLRYYEDLDACLAETGRADVCLAAGVLQTLDRPYERLQALAAAAERVLLVSLPFTAEKEDFVAAGEGAEPYPLWFFSRARFAAQLAANGLRICYEADLPETSWLVNGARTPPARTLLLERGA